MIEKLGETLISAGPLGVVIAILLLHIRDLRAEIKELHKAALEASEEHARVQSEEKDLRIKDAQDSFAALSKQQNDYRDAIHKLADTAQVLARRDEDLDREARDLVRRGALGEGRYLPPRGGSNG